MQNNVAVKLPGFVDVSTCVQGSSLSFFAQKLATFQIYGALGR
jgi:hypothetical protein